MKANETAATVARLYINQLARDEAFQMRAKLDAGAVKRYEGVYRSGKAMPPVKVAQVDGVFILVDGWHRVAALERLGQTQVEAEVVDTSRDEALWMAAQANLEHGVPLKAKELREVFRAYVRSKRHVLPRGKFKSYRDIGAELGKPASTIYNWMSKDFPRVAAKMAGHENFKGTGGLQEIPHTPSQLAPAMQSLQQLLAAFQSTSDPDDRGAILTEAKRVVNEMEGSGNWRVEDPDF